MRGHAAASSEEVARAAFNFSSLFYLKGGCERTRFLKVRSWVPAGCRGFPLLCSTLSKRSRQGCFKDSPESVAVDALFTQIQPVAA